MLLDTFIAGIPCTVDLIYYKGYKGSRESGSGLQLEPDEPACFQIEGIYKRGGKGKHLNWLEKKMTREDQERIEDVEAWENRNG